MGLFLPLPGGVFSRPGLGPAADLPFFDSSKKGRPKKDDPDARDPFAALRGNLRRAARGGRRGTHFALRATFKQTRRVRSPGSPVLWPDCQPPRGPPPAPAYRGGGAGPCCARPPSGAGRGTLRGAAGGVRGKPLSARRAT